MIKHLVFATANKHKIGEVMQVLNTDKFQIQSLADIGIMVDIDETGDTLEENALIKARYVWNHKEIDVFSEDTGLEVDALSGAPGVITARYAGPQKDAIDNMNLLLKNLADKPDRSAQFRAVMALIVDGKEVLFEGIIRGRIADQIAEGGGFGYDPIFIPEGHNKTFAELPESAKFELSHRTRALRKLMEFLS